MILDILGAILDILGAILVNFLINFGQFLTFLDRKFESLDFSCQKGMNYLQACSTYSLHISFFLETRLPCRPRGDGRRRGRGVDQRAVLRKIPADCLKLNVCFKIVWCCLEKKSCLSTPWYLFSKTRSSCFNVKIKQKFHRVIN